MEIAAARALTSERIRLRELRESDLEELVSWWQDPEVMVTQTGGPYHPQPSPGVADQFRRWSANTGSDVGFAVESEGALAGHATLFGITAHNRAATFAILIGPPHQNRGLGTETTRMMLAYGFDELGLHRIGLYVNGFNERAIAAYRKAGFVEEGRAREAIYRSGAWHDQITMGILDHEWRAAHP